MSSIEFVVFSEDKSKLPSMAVSHWRSIQFGERSVGLYVPDSISVKAVYEAARDRGDDVLFPYWAHLWPSSLAMCEMLAEATWIIRGFRVLELAAGLGLPSLFVSGMAASVCCSDRSSEAIALVKASANRNVMVEFETMVIDWNYLPAYLPYDVVLLSDVNYDPEDLPALRTLFDQLLAAGIRMVLSTPERIVATDLLNHLMPFVRLRRQYEPEPGRIVHVFCLAQSEDGFTSNR
jgi:predicted nicotinamide N-methyase